MSACVHLWVNEYLGQWGEIVVHKTGYLVGKIIVPAIQILPAKRLGY